jgi:ubiquitin-conjugating enzyme E2 O
MPDSFSVLKSILVQLYLDGTVQVTGADQSEAVYPVERLTKLTDGLDQVEDIWGDDDVSEDGSVRTNGMWAMDEDGIWQQQDVDIDADEWESMDGDVDDADDAMDVEETGWNDDHLHDVELPEVRLPPLSAHPKPDTAHPNDHDVSDESQSSTPTPVPPRSLSADALPNVDKSPEKDLPPPSPTNIHFNTQGSVDKDPPSRFDILSAAPQDHAFYNSAPAQHSKSFLARLTREYRVLASSLPESIIVRTYEDRTDLLRSLILGPENTPYEDAPFVIDWMLDSNFPNSAPIAHFWSWTGGNGRGEKSPSIAPLCPDECYFQSIRSYFFLVV